MGAPDPQPSASVSPARQVIARAEAMCQRMTNEFDAQRPANQSTDEIVRLVPARAAAEKRVVSELRRLRPPASLVAHLRQIIAYRTALADQLVGLEHAAKANDTARVRMLGKKKEIVHTKLLVAASEAGIVPCARTG
jgi:hypothetical protein